MPSAGVTLHRFTVTPEAKKEQREPLVSSRERGSRGSPAAGFRHETSPDHGLEKNEENKDYSTLARISNYHIIHVQFITTKTFLLIFSGALL